jgi:hypothetical protein
MKYILSTSVSRWDCQYLLDIRISELSYEICKKEWKKSRKKIHFIFNYNSRNARGRYKNYKVLTGKHDQ